MVWFGNLAPPVNLPPPFRILNGGGRINGGGRFPNHTTLQGDLKINVDLFSALCPPQLHNIIISSIIHINKYGYQEI